MTSNFCRNGYSRRYYSCPRNGKIYQNNFVASKLDGARVRCIGACNCKNTTDTKVLMNSPEIECMSNVRVFWYTWGQFTGQICQHRTITCEI